MNKEKHIYLGIGITLAIVLNVIHYTIDCDYYYIQKTVFVPFATFLVIGISKKIREINQTGCILMLVLLNIVIDFSFFFLRETIEWFYIVSIILSGGFTYLLRLIIHKFFNTKEIV